MAEKIRLDRALVDRGLAGTRQRALALILAGKVLVDDRPADKAGTLVAPDREIKVKGEEIPYVSRGGLKLEAALRHFDLDPAGAVCLDVGASTGGFTDCLLQHGAARVYAVDVGYGQLAWKLRRDSRVVAIERTNIRHMDRDAVPGVVDWITIDVSFISLRIVVPAALPFLRTGGTLLALIKPQFEVGRGRVGKGGVVRDPEAHRRVVASLSDFFAETGLTILSHMASPILGPKGNREFMIHLCG